MTPPACGIETRAAGRETGSEAGDGGGCGRWNEVDGWTGSDLRAYREAQGVAPSELAQAIYSHTSHLRDVENGAQNLTRRYLRRVLAGIDALRAEHDRKAAEIRRIATENAQKG